MEVAINPEELEGLDDAAVQALYRQRLASQQAGQQREVWAATQLLLRVTEGARAADACPRLAVSSSCPTAQPGSAASGSGPAAAPGVLTSTLPPAQDFSDLVAQKASQQKRKAEAKQSQTAKKQKESFKF